MKAKLWQSKAVQGAVFILLPLLLSLMMYSRMIIVLQNYMESQVAAQATVLGELASREISARLDELERIAGYYQDNKVAGASMISSFERLLTDFGRNSCGILTLGGTALCGEALPAAEYPAVRRAFQGYRTVRYTAGKGLLFTVPVYNGGNIKYVLYEFCDEKVMFTDFGSSCYDGKMQFLLADGSQQEIIAIDDKWKEDPSWFSEAAGARAMNQLEKRLATATAAAVYCSSSAGKEFLLVSEIGQGNLYVLGRVPYDVVAGSVSSLSGMTLLVFGLLLVLLIIGTFNLFTVSAKARESDALREAKQAAEEAYQSKSKFLANMSHELRTPINVILGMDEMILREDTGVTTRERAMDIKSAAQILLGLINDVLDFSKIEAGNLNIIPVEYDLVALIRDLVLLSENRARQKSLNFEMEIQPDLPVGLYGDDLHIRQIMINLLTNAVKYTEEGTVTLKMTGEKKGNNTLVLHCMVKDTGIGIREDDLQKLFIPYSRVEERRNRNVEGSGLGLPIIVNLLRLMGSELKVESVYGEGSEFFFDLEQGIVDAEAIGDIQERLNNMAKDYAYQVSFVAPLAHILMVDDNAMNRSLFENLLKKTRIQITTASSGKKALELVQQEHYDIIFMDYLMPEMDGGETLGRMRTLENNLCKDTPVIALTANAFNGSREHYMEMGFDDFLSKPIVTEKLEAMIWRLLPKEYISEAPKEAPAGEAEKKISAPEGEKAELPEIEGVNWDYAHIFLRDDKILFHSLREFYDNIDAAREKISAMAKAAHTEAGMSDYRVFVHSVKSNAAMVGVLSVSELARFLERAAQEGAQEKVQAVTPALLEELLRTKEHLRPFMEEEKGEEEKPVADEEILRSLFGMLRFSMERRDIGGTDRCMRQIRAYSYPEDLQKIVDRVGKKVAELDYSGAEKEMLIE